MNLRALVRGWFWVMVAGFGAVVEAQEPRTPTRRPQLWGIVVGVENYTDPLIPDARSAARDAGSILGWLLEVGGWGRDHLLYMADLGSRDPGRVDAPRPKILPTQDNLDWAFRAWLPSKKIQPGDLVLLYFAGRVGQVAPPPGSGAPSQHYLLPVDANLGNVAGTGWAPERAIDRLVLDTQGRCQVVCWLATSASGIALPGARPPLPPADNPALASTGAAPEWLGRLTRWPHVTAWLASDRPITNVGLDEPAGLFTRSLLEGLGRGDRDPSLALSLRGLQQNPTLKRQGFRTMGIVNPRLSLRADRFGQAGDQRPEITLQLGHSDRVTAIVASADGHRVITASKDSTIRVWSPKDRTLLRTLTGHEVGVNALTLSADGRWLVSGGSRPVNAVLVHDLSREFRRLVPDQPHEQGVAQVAMLPDGDHLVSIDLGARGFLWDLRESPPTSRPWLEGVDCLAVACGGGPDQGKVVAICGDKSVRIHNASGMGAGVQKRWDETPTSLTLDPSGRWLSVQLEGGRVAVLDLVTGTETTRKIPAGPDSRQAISRQGRLAIGHGEGLSLFSAEGERHLTPRPNARPAFSPDGFFLAAFFDDGPGLLVWQIGGDQPQLVVDDAQADVSALVFAGDGRVLATGGITGSFQTWPLENLDRGPAWTFPPNRSKVQQLSSSPTRRYLLMIDDVGHARVWDLKERSCRQLPGRWTSGSFASADEVLFLTETPGEGHPGRVVKMDVKDGQVAVASTFFKLASDGFEVPGETAFVGLTVSPDGLRVAATADPSQVPLVCVWESRTGRLTHRLGAVRLNDQARSLSFSSDSRHLLTAGDSVEARLWDLSVSEGEPAAPAATFRVPGAAARNISSAAIRPGDMRQVVTGHRDGAIRLWNWREGSDKSDSPPTELAENYFPGAVKALAFASDGPNLYLAAAGDGTSMLIARMSGLRPERIGLGIRPHHSEQINSLAAWPSLPAGGGTGSATFISGSDDTTVKLWSIKDQGLALRGTFSAVGRAADDRDAPKAPVDIIDLDWVVYTPDGHFDASAHGRDLIRFARGERAHPMEQFDATDLYSFDLGERLLGAIPASEVAALDEPPPILVEPPTRVDPNDPEVSLTIRLGSSDLKDVKLFHNNVRVAADVGATEPKAMGSEGGPGRITVPVRLVKGANRFFAMASYQGLKNVFESRSPDVELAFSGEEVPGQLHVLALGVGDYRRNRLKFVEHDAERLSTVLHDRGLEVSGKKGLRIVRTDAEVTPEGVNADFRELSRVTRPQDTVVVFLAGHTGVFDAGQFCLLLPSFPFPDAALADARQRDAVVAREAPGGKADARHVLPYSIIEANLMRVKALKRLVIVDACQAESIFDDAQVKQIRKWMEIRSRRARTSYLLAARRGEPALEVEGLRHGLFTYVLLRGMGGGSIDRELEPEEVTRLNLPDDADFDHDGVISTAELERYARVALPPVARLFPSIIIRGGANALIRPNLPPIDERQLEQGLRIQTANDSFNLFSLAK